MSWRDYFYFTKPERYGITVLLILIVLTLIYPSFHSFFFPPEKKDFTEFIAKVDRYQQLIEEHKAAQAFLEANKTSRHGQGYEGVVSLNLQNFDPNLISREEYLEMGLSVRVANNILSFLKAGGTFRYKEDIQRLYTIDAHLYATLEPYITLPSRPNRDTANPPAESIRRSVTENRTLSGIQSGIIIELNLTDTVELQKIRGIGPSFSRRIISYRERLGGFTSTNQLLEVFGMDSARYQQIAPFFTIDQNYLRKININEADFAALVRHPYIDRNQANSIISIRQRHGLYKSIEDVMKSHLIDQSLFDRLQPYLTIDNP